MDTGGGGWTVILRRRKNVLVNVNFRRPWDDYENGFGDLNSEFWLGLRNIHCLTNRDDVDLMIDLRQAGGSGMTWIYHKFSIDGSNDNYRLHIGEAEGPPNGHDAMAYHDGMLFSTFDNDNDLCNSTKYYNCASDRGGWWYNSCYQTVLTGRHTPSSIGWWDGTSGFNYFQDVEMKVRPKSCPSYDQDSECTKEGRA